MSRRSYKRIPTKSGKVLRFMRQQSGLSLRKAGAAIGISDCMISHIEVGREDVPKGRLKQLVTLYGFSVEDYVAYMEGRRLPINYRDECIEMVKQIDNDKLKSVYALLNSLLK